MQSFGVKVSQQLKSEEVRSKARQVMQDFDKPKPTLGKQKLRDGKTGEYYDHPVTVGLMTVMNLHHLVEDKVHARATSHIAWLPSSPWAGSPVWRSAFWRDGSLECLEAYGAAYTLQEMLTVKSDDVEAQQYL